MKSVAKFVEVIFPIVSKSQWLIWPTKRLMLKFLSGFNKCG